MPDHGQRVGADLSAAPGAVAGELARDALGVAMLALDVTEHEGAVAGQLERQGVQRSRFATAVMSRFVSGLR